MKKYITLLTAAFVVCSAASLRADLEDWFWTGNGGNNLWSTPANWTSTSANPLPQSNDNLHFAGSNQTTNVNDLNNPQSVAAVFFDDGADPFTLNGNAIGFFNNTGPNVIQNNSESLQTLNFDGFGIYVNIPGGGPLSIDAAVGDLQIDCNITMQDASVEFNGDGTTTVNGVITDSPATSRGITKNGAGTLILNNANDYRGGTTINDGILQVGDPDALGIEEPNIFAATHNDVLLTGGTLQTPEGMPLTFHAPDEYTQSGGTLRIQLGGLASGVDSDLMEVGRSANLGGELFLHRINLFTPTPGDTVTIITTDNGTTPDFNGRPPGVVNGEFDEVNHDFPGLIHPVVIYDIDHVDVTFELTPFSSLSGLNRNEKCVAENLDDVATASGFLSRPAAVNLITFLGNVPTADLREAFELISPDEYASAYTISFSHAVVQNMNLQRHLDAVRAGGGGYCPPSIEIQPMGKEPPINDKNVRMPDKYVAPTAVEMPECRWSFWATGTGQWVDVDGHGHHASDDFDSGGDIGGHGYEIATGGFIGGADYRFGKHFAVGISGAFASGEADLNSPFGHSEGDFRDDGRVQVDGGKIGGYFTAFAGGFYVDGAGSIGWNDYDFRRTGLAPTVGAVGLDTETVHGDSDGMEWNGMIGAGYDFHLGCFVIGPTATWQITHTEIDSFTEDHTDFGGSSAFAGLHFPDQDETSSRLSLGARAAWDWHLGRAIVRPEVRVAWLHDFEDTDYHIRWAFNEDITGENSDRHFCNVFGPNLGRDVAQFGTGLSVQFTRCVALYAYYDGMYGEHYDSHAGSGGLRFGF